MDRHVALTLLFLPLAVWLALPTGVDLAALMVSWRRRSTRRPSATPSDRLLFVVPAHNEELLLDRCLRSLAGIDYPQELRNIAVVADHCTDATASIARAHQCIVLERRSGGARGKGAAIGWALAQLPVHRHSAVVLIDADTTVEPTYATEIAAWGPLHDVALQTYDGMSNEFENALTRLAGLLTRNRYGHTLRLKEAAGLNCPLTGDGVVLGLGVLRRFPWQVATLTEGWELYARLTLAGQRIHYAAGARLYAQEASSLSQSKSQRQRWASGRFAVLRTHFSKILFARGTSILQRMDLLAELSNPGPVTQTTLGLVAAIMLVMASPPGAVPLACLCLAPLAHEGLVSVLSLAAHPEPGRTLRALGALPRYAAWRLYITAGAIFHPGGGEWVRTQRR